MGNHHLRLDPAQIKPLTAAQHGHRDFSDFGCGEDELHMRGRFFERLQQRIEGRGAEHMHLIDDINLVACRGRPVAHPVNQLADVVDPGARGRVHLQHIHMPPLGDGHARLAGPTRLCRGPASPVRAYTIQPFGDNPRSCCFAHPAHASHHKSMRDAVCGEGVFQCAHHRLLPDQVGKVGWAVFSRQNLIGGRGLWGCVTHGVSLAGFAPLRNSHRTCRPAIT